MLRAGVEGLAEGARDAGHDAPIALAVTVLTSEPERRRARRAHATSRATQGATASCARAPTSTSRARVGLRTMVPGIRLAGGDAHDQARVDTPGDAIARGADWLVIGRAVTARRRPGKRGRGRLRACVADALAAPRTLLPADRRLRQTGRAAYTGRRSSSRR